MIKSKRQQKHTRKRLHESDSDSVSLPHTALPSQQSKSLQVTSSRKNKKEPESDEINTLAHKYLTSGTAASLHGDTSTRQLNVDESNTLKSQGYSQGDVLVPDDSGALPTSSLYTSQSSYKHFINAPSLKTTQQSAGGIRAGPLKGQGTVRISCRVDYQPDVCKDYKETGYCGYGDSCKFLHDRGDYKQGYQIDKEWEAKQKLGDQDDNKFLITEDVKAEDELPFACYICRLPFVEPVQTRCNHYFCELCAIKSHKKSPKCQVCGQATNGIFTPARTLLSKLRARSDEMNLQANEIRAREEALGNTLD